MELRDSGLHGAIRCSLLLGQHLPFWYPSPDLGPHTLNSSPPLSNACLPAPIFWMCVK